jgi:spermidine synthase
MSSLFHEVEVALATLGLAASKGDALDVVVGGLGLGYTARAALDEPRVTSLIVIDFLAPVIEWHQAGLVPLGRELAGDPRCRFVQADFFAQVRSPGLDPENPGKLFHAILLDIDHTPRHVLHPSHAALYEPDGLEHLARHLHPGGIFAMWSDAPVDEDYLQALRKVFGEVEARTVTFFNPLQERESASIVYLARNPIA